MSTFETTSEEISFAVVISVKDRFEELTQTLHSVYAQTFLPQELIIVDDCSSAPLTPDNLPSPPVGTKLVIHRNDVNRGSAASLNLGVHLAGAPYIAILDSDDCYLPNALEKSAAHWRTVPADTSVVSLGLFWCTDDLRPYRVQIATPTVTHNDLLIKGNCVGGSSVLSFRRADFLAVGGYPETRGSYDWGLLMRLSTLGPIKAIQEPLLLYRSPSATTLQADTNNYRRQFLAIKELYRMQTPEDRMIMSQTVRQLGFGELAKSGKRKYALASLISLVKHKVLTKGTLVRNLLLLVFGARLYKNALYLYCLLRASLFSKHLLKTYNVLPLYLQPLHSERLSTPSRRIKP